MKRDLFEDEHLMFRDAVRRFVAQEIAPYHEQWEKDGIVPREIWQQAGQLGLLCMDVPEEYGGGGTADFRYNDRPCFCGSLYYGIKCRSTYSRRGGHG